MPTPLQTAIDLQAAEIEAFGQGTAKQPPNGSTEWFLLRAATIGMAYLKRVVELDIEQDYSASERLYRAQLPLVKKAPLPPKPEVDTAAAAELANG